MVRFKVITYNVDGLPDELNLKELPWLFKPIVWLYNKVKGTTVIKVNDNGGSSNRMTKISEYLSIQDPEIIGVQEDFNYHNELMSSLDRYNDSVYKGGFDISKIFSSISWFPFPRFKADGINLLTKHNIKVKGLDIVSWNKSNGYFSHANDLLTHKGFRYYTIEVQGVDIDLYVLHMDADFYHPEKCPDVRKDIETRKEQLKQLTSYILGKSSYNPVIIIGDTNSIDKYSWDVENINEYLLKPINNRSELYIREAVPTNRVDVDRVFYINTFVSSYEVEVSKCYFDEVSYSDHKPLIVEFELKFRAV